jgi:hypothetical protein
VKSYVLLVLAVACAAHAISDCVPKGMVRIETADGSPGIPKDSFARKPKVLYRAGLRYARVEEMPDPEHGIHGLIVVSAPDSYLVNLADKTGRHIVDPDPLGKVRTPVLQDLPAGTPIEFADLDFGCEVDFFAKRRAEQIPYEAVGRKLTKHVLTRDSWRLTLLTSATGSEPQAILLSQNDKVIFALSYLAYSWSPEMDPKLFLKPEGIIFSAAE